MRWLPKFARSPRHNGIASAEGDVGIIDLYLPDRDGIDWSSTYEKKLLT